jgi:hypothetical protein
MQLSDLLAEDLCKIVFLFLDAQQLLELLDAGMQAAQFTKPGFWMEVWESLRVTMHPQVNNLDRGQFLRKLLTAPLASIFSIREDMTDTTPRGRFRRLRTHELATMQSPFERNVIRVLVRTHPRIDVYEKAKPFLGHWAISRHLFSEADILFAREESKDTSRFLNTDQLLMLQPFNNRIGDVRKSRICYDTLSPLVENPFQYFLDSFTLATHKQNDQMRFMRILYPQIHLASIKALFVWYLSNYEPNSSNLMAKISDIAILTVQSVCWFVENAKPAITINFGFDFVPHFKFQLDDFEPGEMIVNPFLYIEFYARDTSLKHAEIVSEACQSTVIYKGSYISLQTPCNAFARRYDLAKFSNTLNLLQFKDIVVDLYSRELSFAEHASCMLEHGCIPDDEFKRSQYVHFIWNHHSVIGMKGGSYQFTLNAVET